MTETIDPTENRKKSVTADEQQSTVLSFYLMPFLNARPLISLPAEPPFYWSYNRDAVLRSTIYNETMWSNAIGIAVTKMQNAGYALEGSKRKVAWAHDLLGNVDFHKGWKYFIQRSGRDYLTTDNGSFIEIIRASKGPGSKIVGLAHLDSLRCRRTGDDEIPVVYRDLVGIEHEMKWHQVFSVVDMPDPSETLRGVGYCAASRAYNTIFKLAAIERYIAEKASGRRPLELIFISNLSEPQLSGALQSAQDNADRKGYTTYMGAAVIPTKSNDEPKALTIPLASIPDFVDIEKERHDTYLRYADAIGLDVQELQPLGHGSGNTATQSVVLDEKERGKFGWFEAFAEQLNLHKIVGGAVTFAFAHKDWRDQQLEAGVRLQRAQTRVQQITSGEITALEARQIAAQHDDIPQEFLDKDIVDTETVYDDDNPDQMDAAQNDATGAPTDAPAQPAQPAPTAPATAAPVPPAVAKSFPLAHVLTRKEEDAQSGDAAEKARSTMDLATITPGRVDQYPEGSMTESLFLEKVAAEFDEYGRLQQLAAQEECPYDTGAMADSIRYAVEDKDSRDISLRWYVGSAERPEVAIRSVLYGRRGFGPKDPKGVLHFESGGEDVFVKHVGPASANDWWGRAWDRTAPQRAAMIRRIGRLEQDMIDVADVKRDNAPNIDGYSKRKPAEVPAKVIKEVALWEPEPIVQGANGHNLWEE